MILIPGLPLVKISVLSQVVNGGVLPFVLIFMLLLINNKELMEEHVNTRSFNVIAWATTVDHDRAHNGAGVEYAAGRVDTLPPRLWQT